MWKYESNDFKDLYLHDNYIAKFEMQDANLVLCFSEGFDILESHVLNDTGKSRCTGVSQIVLFNIASSNIEVDMFQKEKETISLLTLTEDLKKLEVLDFTWDIDNKNFISLVI